MGLDDTEERIAEIRERLSKATPGPWRYDGGNWEIESAHEENLKWYRASICPINNDRKLLSGEPHPHDCMDDGDFIANAPADIAFLLDEVERQKQIIQLQISAREVVQNEFKSKRVVNSKGDFVELFEDKFRFNGSMIIYDEKIDELRKEVERLIECINDVQNALSAWTTASGIVGEKFREIWNINAGALRQGQAEYLTRHDQYRNEIAELREKVERQEKIIGELLHANMEKNWPEVELNQEIDRLRNTADSHLKLLRDIWDFCVKQGDQGFNFLASSGLGERLCEAALKGDEKCE